MEKVKGKRKLCASGHALAIARWEDNEEEWLKGDFFGLRSKKTDLQDLVGNEGTLWIVISRALSKSERSYSLSFRLNKCKKHTFHESGNHGKYAVFGDPDSSVLFASNDARYLLLSLRFDPILPIDHSSDFLKKIKKERTNRMHMIGGSIQTPRCLNGRDVKLLKDFSADVNRWSVFISYKRNDAELAKRIYTDLERRGINVFRDQEALRGGQKWKSAIEKAIEQARHMVVLLGSDTHTSANVKDEIRCAVNNNVNIIPLLTGGKLDDWNDFNLKEIHSINFTREDMRESMKQLAAALQYSNVVRS